MTLAVFTARISARDPDAFDVTRGTADKALAAGRPAPGAPFAPSMRTLGAALDGRRRALTMLAEAKAKPEHRTWYERRALAIDDATWAAYQPRYRAEMLRSYSVSRAAWDDLLAQRRVVLTCFCVDEQRCHRRLLAGYLAKLGAVDRGELRAEPERQGKLW